MIVYLDKNILQEGLSKTIFHFTSLPALKNILEQDCMYLQSSLRGNADDFSKNKLFYLCFTRVADGRFGYSRNRPVRIEFDGDALSYRYSGKPVDYWGETMGKLLYFKNKEFGNKTQARTENEDRLFSKEPVIRDIKKYIKRIDVLINRNNENEMIYGAKFSMIDKVYVYDNEKNFNARNDKTINEELKKDYNLASKQVQIFNVFDRENRVYGDAVFKVVDFILYGECDYKDLNKNAANLLKQYGLEKYTKYVINKLGKCWNIQDYISKGLHVSDDMFNHQATEDYARVMKMLSDYCLKHHISDYNTALKYKMSLNNNTTNIQYDRDKKLDVLAFINNYGINHHRTAPTNLYGTTVILHPETTCVWEIKELNDNVRPFIGSEIIYYVNSFKSKDEESFRKYIQHIVKSNKITVKEYIDFVNKIDMDEENKKSFLLNYGMFDTVTLTAMNSTGKYPDCDFISDEEKKEVDKYFQKINESKENKKTIYINEDKLPLLREGISQIVYHYTPLRNFIKILTDNKLKSNVTDYQRYNKEAYCFSFTRQYSSKVGYPSIGSMAGWNTSQNLVRLTIDGALLNCNYKGRAFDDWGLYDKKHQGSLDFQSEKEMTTQGYANGLSHVESEDMIYIPKKSIDNFDRYITRVQILFRDFIFFQRDKRHAYDEDKVNHIKRWLQYINFLKELQVLLPNTKNNLEAEIYFSEEQFNKRNGKCYDIDGAIQVFKDDIDSIKGFDDIKNSLMGENRNLIKEGLSQKIYSFTDFSSFENIAKTNRLKMSRSDDYTNQSNDKDKNNQMNKKMGDDNKINMEINGKYLYYISFTRSPYSENGFSQWYSMKPSEFSSPVYDGMVRIEFDADKFNQRRDKVSHPVDFFSKQFRTADNNLKYSKKSADSTIIPKDNANTSSKETQLNSLNHYIYSHNYELEHNPWYKDDEVINIKKNMHPIYVQNEDRFMTNTPDEIINGQGYIDNIADYIKRVDIVINENEEENMDMLNNLIYNTKLGKQGKIIIHDDYKSFNKSHLKI